MKDVRDVSFPGSVRGYDRNAVDAYVVRVNAVIAELEHMGMPFDRLENGKIYQRPFGGHTQDYGSPKMAMRACAAAGPRRRLPRRRP